MVIKHVVFWQKLGCTSCVELKKKLRELHVEHSLIDISPLLVGDLNSFSRHGIEIERLREVAKVLIVFKVPPVLEVITEGGASFYDLGTATKLFG